MPLNFTVDLKTIDAKDINISSQEFPRKYLKLCILKYLNINYKPNSNSEIMWEQQSLL